jgi:hypothetical protein
MRRIKRLLAAALLVGALAPQAFAASEAAGAPAAAIQEKQADVAKQRKLLRAKLAKARKLQIARLRAYRKAAKFPRQFVDPAPTSVLVDDRGYLCAVAHLITKAGLGQLVQETAAQNNLLHFADVHDGPLLAWMLSSGLTQEEIAFIQVPYMEPEMPYNTNWEQQEIDRIEDHLVQVEKQLKRDTDASLDLAVDRLLAVGALRTTAAAS